MFLYSIITGLIVKENIKVVKIQRESNMLKYVNEYIKKYNINIDENLYPIPVDADIYNEIEENNNFSFNVYGYEYDETRDKYIRYPLHITSNEKEIHLNLFYVSDVNNGHYTLIKNLSAFLCDINLHKGKIYSCNKCMKTFSVKKL